MYLSVQLLNILEIQKGRIFEITLNLCIFTPGITHPLVLVIHYHIFHLLDINTTN